MVLRENAIDCRDSAWRGYELESTNRQALLSNYSLDSLGKTSLPLCASKRSLTWTAAERPVFGMVTRVVKRKALKSGAVLDRLFDTFGLLS